MKMVEGNDGHDVGKIIEWELMAVDQEPVEDDEKELGAVEVRLYRGNRREAQLHRARDLRALHVPSRLLGRELEVDSIGRAVVEPRGDPPI